MLNDQKRHSKRTATYDRAGPKAQTSERIHPLSASDSQTEAQTEQPSVPTRSRPLILLLLMLVLLLLKVLLLRVERRERPQLAP